MQCLSFSRANTKLKKLAKKIGVKPFHVWSLDLLAGHTCPYAYDCQSKVVEIEGGKTKQVDGPQCKFRCYAATMEQRYPLTYAQHKRNAALLRNCRTTERMVALIERSLPPNTKVVRYHSSGDIFSQAYANAIFEVARRNSHIHFYTYTKSVPFIKGVVDKYLGSVSPSNGLLLPNLAITLSEGGRADALGKALGIRSVNVVTYPGDTTRPINEDDSPAYYGGLENTSIVLHGTQLAGTEGARATTARNREKFLKKNRLTGR